MKNKKILLTAFEPFGGEEINPAWEVAQVLGKKEWDRLQVKIIQVPTVFKIGAAKVIAKIPQEKPDLIISLGQAGGRTSIDLERVAINIADATIPDNKNNQPQDQPISKGGPAAYFSTLPLRKMIGAIKMQGIPVAISNSAGTFVCNDLMYRILHHIQRNNLPIQAGFIHLPYLPNQALQHKNAPSMSLADLVKGVEAAILAATKEAMG